MDKNQHKQYKKRKSNQIEQGPVENNDSDILLFRFCKTLVREIKRFPVESIKGVYVDYKLLMNNLKSQYNRDDSGIEDMIKEHSQKSLDVSWRFFSLFWLFLGVIQLVVIAIAGDINSFTFKRAFNVGPLCIFGFLFARVYLLDTKYFLSVLIAFIGSILGFSSFHFKTYVGYETWMIYIGIVNILITSTGLSWKAVVVPFWFNIIVYIVGTVKLYDNIPTTFFSSFISILFILPLSAILYSSQIKDMLHLLKENQELTKTIKNVLEMFPESVIIQSLDSETKKFITRFANNASYSSKLISDEIKQADGLGQYFQINNAVNMTILDDKMSQEDTKEAEIISFSALLQSQAKKLDNGHCENNTISQMLEAYIDNKFEDTQEAYKTRHFTLKSIKVSWDKNKNSYLHLLVDTSNVTRLQQAKSKYRYQKLMFASGSHEFRTPLNSFSNSLQLIEMQLSSIRALCKKMEISDRELIQSYDNITKYAKVGKISSKMLENLVEDILDLEKFDNGTFSLDRTHFKLSSLLDEIEYIFKWQGQQKGLYFDIKVNSEVKSKQYYTDKVRIKQVLVNLLSNSIKYTLDGGIYVKVIELPANPDGGLMFEVYDTGIGISKKELNDSLFKMFSMIERHKDTINQHGTGIGLVISKMIIESMGGQIHVESKENHFTKFTFTIVCSQDDVIDSQRSIDNYTHTLPEDVLLSGALQEYDSLQMPMKSAYFNMKRINNFMNS